MKIWLVSIGEPIPIEGNHVRLMRSGMLAQELASRGHEVTWWTCTFNHSEKRHLFAEQRKILLCESYRIILLHSIGYKKNISVRRFIDHVFLGHNLLQSFRMEVRPDIIFCCMPALELSYMTVRYGNSQSIPVVIDLRDMWPDIFLNRMPIFIRSIAKFPMRYFLHQIRFICRNARALTGITDGYVEWGLRYANRSPTWRDRTFPLAYQAEPPTAEEIRDAEIFWRREGVFLDSDERFVVCLFANIVRQLDLETVIAAAQRLEKSGRKFRFVFCGRGEALEYFKSVAGDCSTILFPGWVNKAQIWTLMRIAKAGLVPLRSTPDFIISIPNKVSEYMSAGLPIVSSLSGTLQKLLLQRCVGRTYGNGNIEECFRIFAELYDNPSKLRQMGKESILLFREKFQAEKVYGDMCKHLEMIFRDNFDQARPSTCRVDKLP